MTNIVYVNVIVLPPSQENRYNIFSKAAQIKRRKYKSLICSLLNVCNLSGLSNLEEILIKAK